MFSNKSWPGSRNGRSDKWLSNSLIIFVLCCSSPLYTISNCGVNFLNQLSDLILRMGVGKFSMLGHIRIKRGMLGFEKSPISSSKVSIFKINSFWKISLYKMTFCYSDKLSLLRTASNNIFSTASISTAIKNSWHNRTTERTRNRNKSMEKATLLKKLLWLFDTQTFWWTWQSDGCFKVLWYPRECFYNSRENKK